MLLLILTGAIVVIHFLYLETWYETIDVKTPVLYRGCSDVYYVVSKDYDGWSIYNSTTMIYRRGVVNEYLYPANLYWYYLSFIL
jgi:hypothetical protein